MNTFKNITNLLIPFSNGFLRNKSFSGDNLPYHRFSKEDYERLLNPFSSDTDLIFRNSNNEEMKFQFVKSTLGKKVFKKLISEFRFKKYFFYDEQEIQFKVSKNEISKLTFNLKRFPISNSGYGERTIFSENSEFIVTINFPFWNGNDSIVVDYKKTKLTMIINEKKYDSVFILESKKTELLASKSVNKIYFDINKGIIGFDDLSGKEWRLFN